MSVVAKYVYRLMKNELITKFRHRDIQHIEQTAFMSPLPLFKCLYYDHQIISVE